MIKIKTFILLSLVTTASALELKKEWCYTPDLITYDFKNYERYYGTNALQAQRTAIKDSVKGFLRKLEKFKKVYQDQTEMTALADSHLQILKNLVEFDKNRFKIITDGGTCSNCYGKLSYAKTVNFLKTHYQEYLTEPEASEIFDTLKNSSFMNHLDTFCLDPRSIKSKMPFEESFKLISSQGDVIRESSKCFTNRHHINNGLLVIMHLLYGVDKTSELLKPIEQQSKTCKPPIFHVLQITCLREIEDAIEKYPFAKKIEFSNILQPRPSTQDELIGFSLAQLKKEIQEMKE